MPRPYGVPLPSIASAALADKLRPALPQWAMGLEEPGLARHLALSALASGDADLAACGAGLALWSWQRAPLDAARAQTLAHALPQSPAGRLAAALAPRLAAGSDADDLAALMAEGDAGLLVRLLIPRLRHPATGLAWLGAAWDGLLRLGSADLLRAALSSFPFEAAHGPLRARLAAEAAFLYDGPDAALAALGALDEADAQGVFAAFADYLRAELMLRAGAADSGRALLSGLHAALPWHTHLALKRHALETPLPVAGREELCRAVILLYSWNKAELTRQTLASLAATDGALCRIVALDNGSADGTGAAMRAACALFPAGAMRVVELPVNVGAPAARNWLLAQPEVAQSDFAVFLDDDVILPERWLGRLLGAALADPEAAAAGCRITSATRPACLQSADYQLFAPLNQPRNFATLPENVNVFENCGGAPDVGLFSYARPAAHVSGCCHALRTAFLPSLGGFDIRFSPTQFDDLDRDLRAAEAGHRAVYAGDVAIAHVQHSSLAKSKGAAAVGHVFGNKIKLEGKHPHATVDRAFRAGLEALWRDLRAKLDELASGAMSRE